MSKLAELFKDLNIPSEKLNELAKQFSENPLMAMALVQELNIPPETLQQAMAVVMANPEEISTFAKSLGISDEVVDEARGKLETFVPEIKK